MYRTYATVFIAMAVALSACTSPARTDGDATDSQSPAPKSAQLPQMIGDYLPEFQSKIGDRVFFDFDSSVLSKDAQATLQRQAAWFKKYGPDVVIEGHADERGTREYNLALGARRANAVRNYLIAQGVPADWLTTISYGKERPAVVATNETGWAANRRAVSVPLPNPQHKPIDGS